MSTCEVHAQQASNKVRENIFPLRDRVHTVPPDKTRKIPHSGAGPASESIGFFVAEKFRLRRECGSYRKNKIDFFTDCVCFFVAV